LFQITLEAGKSQPNWTGHQLAVDVKHSPQGWATTPDHAWAEKLPDNWSGRAPERAWFATCFRLARCLTHTQPEAAAPWLRMISLSVGSRGVDICQGMLKNGVSDCQSLRIGETAAQMLSNLHFQADSPASQLHPTQPPEETR